MIPHYKAYDLYVNSTFKHRYYSKKKAINIAQTIGNNLFNQTHVDVIDVDTGEVLYNT